MHPALWFKKLTKSFTKSFETINWIELSQSALEYNYKYFQNLNPNQYAFPVLKSNAYGHGLIQIAKMLQPLKPKYLVVDGYFEALEIHESFPYQPILIMGAIDLKNVPRLKFKNFSYVVHDLEFLQALGKLNKNIKIHLELNTGMNRHGIEPEEVEIFIKELRNNPKIVLEGLMSHLADADNPEDESYNLYQTKLFDEIVEQFLKAGFRPSYIHLAQSAGSFKIKSSHTNTFRLGYGLYGFNPLNTTDLKSNLGSSLRPVLSVHTKITKIINIKAGVKVSYNGIYEAKNDTKIAIIPFGYYEGLSRDLSNQAKLKVIDNNSQIIKFCQIAGRVCMNHTMLDIGYDSTFGVGDEVVIYSSNQLDPNSIQNLSQEFGIFSYSTLVYLNQNIRRRIVD